MQTASFNISYLVKAIRNGSARNPESLALLQAMQLIIQKCKLMCRPDVAHVCAAASCNSCDRRREEFCDRLWEAGLLTAAKKELAALLTTYATDSICAPPEDQARLLRVVTVAGCKALDTWCPSADDCAEINLAMQQQDALMRARLNPRGD